MKTIEQRAHDYASSTIDGKFEPTRLAYIAGATDALKSQWRSVDEPPQDGEDVLIYTTYIGAKSGKPKTLIEQYTYFADYGFELKERSERHLQLRVLAWMPIPDYKPKTK